VRAAALTDVVALGSHPARFATRTAPCSRPPGRCNRSLSRLGRLPTSTRQRPRRPRVRQPRSTSLALPSPARRPLRF